MRKIDLVEVLQFSEFLALPEEDRSIFLDILGRSDAFLSQIFPPELQLKSIQDIPSFLQRVDIRSLAENLDLNGWVSDFSEFPLTQDTVFTSIHSSYGEGQFHGLRYYDSAHTAVLQEFQRLSLDAILSEMEWEEDVASVDVEAFARQLKKMAILLSWEEATKPSSARLVKGFNVILSSFASCRGKMEILGKYLEQLAPDEPSWCVPLEQQELSDFVDEFGFFGADFDWSDDNHVKWLRMRLSPSDSGI